MVLGSFSVVGEVVLGGGHHDHQRVVPFGDDQRGALVGNLMDQPGNIAVDLGQRDTNDLFHFVVYLLKGDGGRRCRAALCHSISISLLINIV